MGIRFEQMKIQPTHLIVIHHAKMQYMPKERKRWNFFVCNVFSYHQVQINLTHWDRDMIVSCCCSTFA